MCYHVWLVLFAVAQTSHRHPFATYYRFFTPEIQYYLTKHLLGCLESPGRVTRQYCAFQAWNISVVVCGLMVMVLPPGSYHTIMLDYYPPEENDSHLVTHPD